MDYMTSLVEHVSNITEEELQEQQDEMSNDYNDIKYEDRLRWSNGVDDGTLYTNFCYSINVDICIRCFATKYIWIFDTKK